MKRLLLALIVAAAATLGIAAMQPSGCPSGAVCLGSADARPVYFIQDGLRRFELSATGLFRTYPGGGATSLGAPAKLCGTLDVSTTTSQTAADTNLTTLYSFTLAPNTLTAAGQGVEISAWGAFGATANTKNEFISFGGTTIYNRSSTGNAVGWHITSRVIRITATSEAYMGDSDLGGTAFAMVPATASEDLTTGLVIAMKSQNGTAAAGDTVFNGARVTCF
jgi:hypothetical protein